MKNGLYVVMGVAGSGKSQIGSELARALGIEFVEGDDFHSATNIEHMAAGIPLTDEDRADWLHALAFRLRVTMNAGTGVVIACSALKRAYRDTLRAGAPKVQFVFLKGPPDVIAQRLATRAGHYMRASMLDSQLAILEEPSPDEHAWVCDITQTPQQIVDELLSREAQ